MWVLWLAASLTFFFLTYFQAKCLEKRAANINNILVGRGESEKPNDDKWKRFRTDYHLYTVLFLSLVLFVVSGCRICSSWDEMMWPGKQPPQAQYQIEWQINGNLGGAFEATFKSK